MQYRIYSREENCTVTTINGKLSKARKKAFNCILNGWDKLLIQIVRKNGECRTVGFMARCTDGFANEIGYFSLYRKDYEGHIYYVTLNGNLKHRYDPEEDRHVSWEMVFEEDSAYMFHAYHTKQ